MQESERGRGAVKPQAARQPFPLAADLQGDEDPTPLMTPFQRYVLDGLSGLGTEVAALKTAVKELAPRVDALQQRAAMWGKMVHYAKFLWPMLALEAARLFPALAKYIPVITDAIQRANP